MTMPLFRMICVASGVFFAGCAKSTNPIEYEATVDASGCIVEQITVAEYDEYQVFGVSNDGTWLSTSWNTGYDDIGVPIGSAHLLNLRTGEIRALPSGFNNSGAFSNDEQFHVSAQYMADGKTDIVEVELETAEVAIIAKHPAYDWLPSYSPDDRYIVFNSYREGNQADVYLYERSNGELTRLTEGAEYEAHAQFAPSGESVLFHRMNSVRDGGGYDFDLISIDLATSTETRLTALPVEESYAAYAPDGRHIVFSSDFDEAPEKSNLYILDPSGDISAQLTDGDWKDSYAYWTRDGQYVYFNSDRTGATNVYRIPMSGFDCQRESYK